ncbi:hypothetical protein [Parapedobacter pyrenivorans]|nr:hypothetical protein [Parapedobacter pyrenivorans]
MYAAIHDVDFSWVLFRRLYEGSERERKGTTGNRKAGGRLYRCID